MSNVLEERLSNFINAIKSSLQEGNWYSALTLALTLPDICGKLEYPNWKVGKRYIKWFNDYLLKKNTRVIMGEKVIFLTGRDAYALRCSYLHGGEGDISQQYIKEILNEFFFMVPKIDNGDITGAHRIKINDKLVLRVDLFCNEICEAVEEWVNFKKGNQKIQERASNMMEIHTGGITMGNLVRIE